MNVPPSKRCVAMAVVQQACRGDSAKPASLPTGGCKMPDFEPDPHASILPEKYHTVYHQQQRELSEWAQKVGTPPSDLGASDNSEASCEEAEVSGVPA
jgi:hypothetical protein